MLFPGYEEQLRLANEESLDPVLSNEERLYFKVSDEKDFSDCHEDLQQNCNKLEREYFEVLHIKNVAPNERYVDTPVLVYSEPIKDFEEAHFHEYNVTPNRPCSAFFKTDSFMPAAQIFDALCKDGLKPEHLRCLQRKPTGEIFVTFHRVQSSFHPSSYCEVVWYWRGTFKEHGGLYNGLRHYCVHTRHAIPSLLRFGKFQIRLYYDGQMSSCRKSN